MQLPTAEIVKQTSQRDFAATAAAAAAAVPAQRRLLTAEELQQQAAAAAAVAAAAAAGAADVSSMTEALDPAWAQRMADASMVGQVLDGTLPESPMKLPLCVKVRVWAHAVTSVFARSVTRLASERGYYARRYCTCVSGHKLWTFACLHGQLCVRVFACRTAGWCLHAAS